MFFVQRGWVAICVCSFVCFGGLCSGCGGSYALSPFVASELLLGRHFMGVMLFVSFAIAL